MDVSNFFLSPSVLGILLALVFGAIWLAILAPAGWRTIGLWLMFLGGAVLFIPSIVLIQSPLQWLVSRWLINWMGAESYIDRILFTGIPVVLLSGLVQEGAKLLPPVIYWLTKKKEIEPRTGLFLGAMAGAGFGLFEAQSLHTMIFASGWGPDIIESMGILAFAGFWERFFTIGFHIAVCSLAGWGLAKGHGWQFYLLAVLCHFLLNYMIIPAQLEMLSLLTLEITVAVFAVILFAVVVWLRRRKEQAPLPVTPQTEPIEPILEPQGDDGSDIYRDNTPDTR